MKFLKIRYKGTSAYKDRTPLKNEWEPGDEKLVSEADARKLLGYLEFERVVVDESAPKKAAKQGKKAEEGAGDGVDSEAAAALEQAMQAQAQAKASQDNAEKLTESTLLEVDQMDKEQLESYARANYGVELDKRRSLDNMRNQVTALVQGGKA